MILKEAGFLSHGTKSMRKQFEDTYIKESDNGNFMNADKAGFYEECYRNVIKDLKEEVQ